jgi:hypothetical protein
VLSLNDPRWEKLRSNYGTGAAVVQLIRKAAAGDPLDHWFDDLFQELLHQYTLSEAAYPAVPHLVQVASENQDARKALVVLIGGCFAASGGSASVPIPEDFEAEWGSARQDALLLALDILRDSDLDGNDIRYLLSSVAAFKGENELSVAIEALDVEIRCPECGNLIAHPTDLER